MILNGDAGGEQGMEAAVGFDEARGRDVEDLAQGILAGVVGNGGVETREGAAQTTFEHNVGEGGTLGMGHLGGEIGAVRDGVAELSEPVESRFLDDDSWRGDRMPATRIRTIERVVTFIAAVMGLLGLTLVGILSQALKMVTDPWQVATLVTFVLLVSSVFYFGSQVIIYRKVVNPELVEELTGRQVIVERARHFIREASESVRYIAGDFSSVKDIEQEIKAARNRNVKVRILGPHPDVDAVHANLVFAAALGCAVRLYHPDVRRLRVAIIDYDATSADGTVVFIKKSHKAGPQRSHQAKLDTRAEFEYVGTVYKDPMVITGLGQLFDALWNEAEPFEVHQIDAVNPLASDS